MNGKMFIVDTNIFIYGGKSIVNINIFINEKNVLLI